jgi:threonyl-tRNA synthetase
MKIPYTLVVGDKEIEAGTVSVRDRAGHEVRGVPFVPFADAVAEEARSRALEGVDVDVLRAAG